MAFYWGNEISISVSLKRWNGILIKWYSSTNIFFTLSTYFGQFCSTDVFGYLQCVWKPTQCAKDCGPITVCVNTGVHAYLGHNPWHMRYHWWLRFGHILKCNNNKLWSSGSVLGSRLEGCGFDPVQYFMEVVPMPCHVNDCWCLLIFLDALNQCFTTFGASSPGKKENFQVTVPVKKNS